MDETKQGTRGTRAEARRALNARMALASEGVMSQPARPEIDDAEALRECALFVEDIAPAFGDAARLEMGPDGVIRVTVTMAFRARRPNAEELAEGCPPSELIFDDADDETARVRNAIDGAALASRAA